MALDSKRPTAGAFSLASYVTLDPLDKITLNLESPHLYPWSSIEVHYFDLSARDLNDLAQKQGLKNSGDLNFHFVIYNHQSSDGRIEPTKKWLRQRSALPDKNWYGSTDTIRICVLKDPAQNQGTNTQIKRTTALVEKLTRVLAISTNKIKYPQNWQL